MLFSAEAAAGISGGRTPSTRSTVEARDERLLVWKVRLHSNRLIVIVSSQTKERPSSSERQEQSTHHKEGEGRRREECKAPPLLQGFSGRLVYNKKVFCLYRPSPSSGDTCSTQDVPALLSLRCNHSYFPREAASTREVDRKESREGKQEEKAANN